MRKRRALYLLGALGGIAFLSKRSKGALMHHQKDIARRFIEEPWDNVDVLDELLSSDYVGYDPSMPEPLHGAQAAKDFVKTYKAAYPDASVTADEIIGDGDHVAVRWTARGTHEGDLMGMAATGKQVTVSGMSFFHLSDRKIVEEWSNWDTFGMLTQLGVVEAPVSA